MRWLLLLLALGVGARAQQAPPPVAPPRLLLVVIVDGLPADVWRQHHADFPPGGFRRVLDDGAHCTDARYGHLTTYTACGHSTLLTGADPAQHGVIGNDWLDAHTGQRRYCVADPAHRYLDEPTPPHAGTSPASLEVTTVGDELTLATGNRARVVAVSLKDRGAILSAGKLGQAWFYSPATGRFITTDYYRTNYPAWWHQFHQPKPQDRWFGRLWDWQLPATALACVGTEGCTTAVEPRGLRAEFPQPITGGLAAPGPRYYSALRWTPFGDEYLAEFARAVVRGENLGRHPDGVSDLLAISFSATDYIQHLFGPESKPARDQLFRLDRVLAALFSFLDEWVGPDQWAMVLSADHGFTPTPEFLRDHVRLRTGRVDPPTLLAALDAALAEQFGPGSYTRAWWTPTIWLDVAAIERRGLVRAAVETAAARWLETQPGIHAVFTRTQLLNGQMPATVLASMVARSWHRQRSGDLVIVTPPGWYFFKNPDEHCANHGSAWSYDTHVPLGWWGPRWVTGGEIRTRVDMVDVAPTLAALLGVRRPIASSGRLLHEVLR
jgi:predicted AlkP superfamily pyrophosphatase or phosphodiesterase